MKNGNRQADEENLLSHRHHLVVQALWEDVEQGLPDSAELPAFLSILEVLVESISKVCRLNEHPALFLALCIGYVLIFSVYGLVVWAKAIYPASQPPLC